MLRAKDTEAVLTFRPRFCALRIIYLIELFLLLEGSILILHFIILDLHFEYHVIVVIQINFIHNPISSMSLNICRLILICLLVILVE